MDGPYFDLQRFSVYGTEGNEILDADSSYSYVYAYGGNDTINNYGYSGVVIYAGTGNDSIVNYGSSTTIDAGTGNDKIYNNAVNYVSVSGGTGNDSISNYSAWYSTVNGGDGNDTIVVPYRAWQDSINGGTGDDRISLGTTSNDSYNGYNTIMGSAGNDTIYGNPNATVGNVYQYYYGDGYDVITNWNAKDTLSFGSGIYYTRSTVNGSNVLLGIVNSSGSSIGAITLSGASGKTINISGGTPTIISNNVYGTSGKDYLSVKASKSSVIAYGGNDSIYNGAWDSVTIDAGDGDDTITNSTGWYGSINGGAGNDKISLTGSQWYDTVRGGTGNDTIYGTTSTYGDGIVYQYNVGDGYDSITNWRSTDTVRFGSDVYYTRSTVGSNVLLGIVNSSGSSIGAITLSCASGKTINISGGTPTIISNNVYGTSGKDYLSVKASKSSVIAYGGDDSIYNGGWDSVTIDAGTGNDSIVNYGSSTTIYAGDGNDTIFNNYVNNVLVSGDTGNDSISNYSAWYSTVNGGDGNDTIVVPFRAWYDSIVGGAGDDKISLGTTSNDSYNGYNTIMGSAGNDTIYGNPNATVGNVYQYYYGDGYDVITNWNAKDTLSFGSGIYYTRSTVGSNVLFGIVNSSGSSIGAITLSGASGKTINISGGTPTNVSSVIYNYNKNSLVSGSSANDTIYNYAGGATIRGNGGNDYIDNSTSSYYTVNGGYGYVTIDGGDGNDTIKSYDPYVSLSGGAGADMISLRPSSFNNVTVNGSTGNDTIYGNSSGGGVLYQYKKGDGNDLIYYFSANDTLSISGGSYTTTTSGNNILVNIAGGEKITLQGAKGMSPIIYPTISPVIINYNNDTIVNGTSSNDTIYNSGSRVKIYASTGNDSIYNGGDYHDNVTIDAGAGNDTIFNNYVNNVSVSGGTGDDSISNYSAWYSTIDAGTGNDTIIVPFRAWHDSINGGADNDRISLGTTKNEYNGYNTIVGGKGDDTIYGNPNATVGNVYQYAKGDGNDIIYSYNAKDSITITGGGSWSTVTSGSNVIVKVADSGNMTLVGAKGKTLNIYPEKSPDPDPTPPSTDVTAQDVIKKFMEVLDTTTYSGRAALNEAVKVATGGYFSNLDAAIDQMILDCKNTNNATRFLSEYCDIDLTNTDTGAITGSDAGGATTKTASSIVPESGRLDSSFTGSSFTTKGLTVQLSSFDFYGNNYNTTYDKLSGANQKYIWQALKTWWVDGAINLITSSYGNNYGFGSGATGNKLNFGFYNEDSGVMAVTTGWYTDSSHKTIGKLDMKVNMKNYANLIVGDEDGKISGKNGFQLDRVLAHEFTHALMYVNINYAGDLPNFIMEGMAELTHGTDDDRKSELTNLAKNPSALTNALNFDCYDSYAGGYMFLRYLAKQGSEHYSALSSSSAVVAQSKSADASSSGSSSGVSVKNSVLTLAKDFSDSILDLTNYNSVKTVNATAMGTGIMIIGNKNPSSISAGAGADSIFANVGNDTINGGAGKDVLYGEAGNDVIKGEAGDDSINGGTGNDTLTGGDGKDVFIFGTNSGNDVITDYTAGQDKIKLLDGSVTSASVNGSDVVLSGMMTGTITIKGGKGQKITVIDGDGVETTKTYDGSSGGGGDTVVGGKTLKVTKTPVTLDSSYANADASAMTKAVKITGNDAANSIVGGSKNDSLYGASGNDTLLGKAGNDKIYGQASDDFLWGESGNDTLYGGDGNDVFIYSAGKDVIADFTVGDKISLGAEISNSSVKGSDVIFTIGSGSLTIKDGKGKTLSMIDKSGKAYTTVVGGSGDTVVGGKTLKVTKTPVTLDSSYANADASAMTKAVKITGNDAANSIVGGSKNDSLYGASGNDTLLGKAGNDKIYGQAGNDVLYGDAGNDSLWGGDGNDTLFGGDGNDVFIYGTGKDVICGFETGDMLQITEAFTGTYNKSSKTISIKVGSTANAITITDFTATTFNINGDTYGISGTKLVKK